MPPVISKEPETPRRLFTVKCVNASRQIHLGPCIVGSIIITSTDGTGVAKVYDGLNALAERKFYLSCVVNTTTPVGEGEDHDFKHGIYVEVTDITTFLMISYYPLEV